MGAVTVLLVCKPDINICGLIIDTAFSDFKITALQSLIQYGIPEATVIQRWNEIKETIEHKTCGFNVNNFNVESIC
jgi:hypothetical protein